MLEQVYTFGSSAQLIGIHSKPAENTSVTDAPTVLLLNAGLLHRPGPYRMHVDLARRLSALGFPVFRFDLSGIGDSEKHRDSRPREEQIISDICESMDHLAARNGAKTFVVIGLCTGADNAHKISVQDERVVGAVFLDGYCYPTTRFYARLYGPKIFNPAVWLYALKRNIIKPLLEKKPASQTHDKREDNYFWKLPPKQQTEGELNALVKRGVNLLYIFSGASDFINYKEQLADSMKNIDFGNHLQVEYLQEAEHTYPIIADRQQMMTIICNWMQAKYASIQ